MPIHFVSKYEKGGIINWLKRFDVNIDSTEGLSSAQYQNIEDKICPEM